MQWIVYKEIFFLCVDIFYYYSQLHTVRANAVLPRQELGTHGVDDMIKME